MHKIELDINGVELKHGDKVATIRLNGRARGGDLVEAYIYRPDISKPSVLVISKADLNEPRPRTYYDLYTRLHNKVLVLNN